MLRLLVRIEDDLAGRPADVADRQRDRELTALGLGQPADSIRCRIRYSSASLIVPFRPSSSRSLQYPGS